MEIPEIIRSQINPDLGPFFDVEKILAMTQGAVVLDMSTIDGIYVTANNTGKKDALAKAIAQNRIIPVNADTLGFIASHHALLHGTLVRSGIPIIPTFMRMYTDKSEPEVVNMANYEPMCLPGVMVHKKSGEGFSHGGKGVSIIGIRDVQFNKLEPATEFVQPFIIPPADSSGHRFVTDTRVVIVDGKPIAGITRKAEEPISKMMALGLQKPGIKNFPTAEHPGQILEPDPIVWERVSRQAEQIAAFLAAKIPDYKSRLFSPLSPVGYASMDFLLDSAGQPLLVDFDLQPMIRPQIIDSVAKSIAENLVRLAKYGSQGRSIIVLGEPVRDIVQATLTKLTGTKYPTGKIIWQDYQHFYK